MGDLPSYDHDTPSQRNAHTLAMVAEFAAQLRDLRTRAGSPSFRELAKRTHYSSSTLAEATAGKRLPTEAVLKAFVTECGGDPDEWVARLRQTAESVRQSSGSSTSADRSDAAEPQRGRLARRTTWLVAGSVGIFVVGGGVGALITTTSSGNAGTTTFTPAPFTAVPTTVPTGAVPDGADPAAAGCGADAVLVDRSPILIDGTQVGALDLAYSHHCQAGWARLFLYPGQPTMMGLATVKANDGRASSIAEPLVKQIDIYTNVILPGTTGCIGAQATVLETAHPAVTATISCQMPTASSPLLK